MNRLLQTLSLHLWAGDFSLHFVMFRVTWASVNMTTLPQKTMKLNKQEIITNFFRAYRQYDKKQCLVYLKKARLFCQIDPTFHDWVYCFEGIFAFVFEDWVKAEQIFKKLQQHDLEPYLHAVVMFNLGRVLDARGHWKDATDTFQQCATDFEQLGHPLDQARALRHIGITYQKGFDKGDFDVSKLRIAIKFCDTALEIIELVPHYDNDKRLIWLKGSVWNTLGIIYKDLDEFETSLEYFNKCLLGYTEIEDKNSVAYILGNMGEVYL